MAVFFFCFFSRSVEAIVSKHPDQKDAKDSMGRIPLHHACSEEVQTQALFFFLFFCSTNFVNASKETCFTCMH